MLTDRDREFTAFVLTHRPALVRTARMVSAGDAHRAEDLVQLALTRVYVRWPRVRADSALPYARRAVINAAADEGRRRHRRPERLVADLPESGGRPDPGHEAAPALRALAHLAPRMRATVALRYVEGLSVDEVADAVGCSAGTVKSQSAKGLARLRQILAPPAPDLDPEPEPETAVHR